MLLASGIFRDVLLVQTEALSVWDYEIVTRKDQVTVKVTLWDADYTNATVTVELDGQTVTKPASKTVDFSVTVEDPRYWNAETPNLYPLYITLLESGREVEIHTKQIGLRDIRIEGHSLLVNDTPITLKGINRHEHDPKNGRAITVERIERELKLLKDHNFNAIRCAHYTNHPAFYEVASELGIYVMDENDLETHGAHAGTGDQGWFSKQPAWKHAILDRTRRMVERDKNETCITIFSMGNEHGDGENIREGVAYIRERTGNRFPVFHTVENWRDPEVSDFRMNGYMNMESLMSFPEEGKPVVLLEYGHAMGNSPGLMEDTWDYVYFNRHVIGGYTWEFKNHGFYAEDENGTPFYKFGGDFEDYNHWSNFSMDGYCLSDGTPKPSLRDCKNVHSPCYVKLTDGKITVMNTNDFRPLDYVRMVWEITEDYHVLQSGETVLPAVKPYETAVLDIPTALPGNTPGATYYATLRFYDETGFEIGVKQVCLGSVPAEAYEAVKPAATVEQNGADFTVTADTFTVKVSDGLLSYYERAGKILLDAPMQLNFYRAPTDNDGIVNFSARWIGRWGDAFLKHWKFHARTAAYTEEDTCIRITVTGKVLPVSRLVGYLVTLTYRIYADGLVLTEYEGTPYGDLPEALPRMGVCFKLAEEYTTTTWYGRGEDENYCDRKAHCPFGLYSLPIKDMNFQYDVPQECGTRTETRFVSVTGGDKVFTVVGAGQFDFSCHDFTLQNLETARHRNELVRTPEKYLYIDYKMRGLGSHSCGPNPEEQYELRPHAFRLVFALCDGDADAALAFAHKSFAVRSEALSGKHEFHREETIKGVIECDINRD
jgi:beta-galactosidase/evolved beta-galactosidase subunit alpha